jgi:hypothetical protein
MPILTALVVLGACGGGGVPHPAEQSPAKSSTFLVTISGVAETLEHSTAAEVTIGK